jgi:hypothetical protein
VEGFYVLPQRAQDEVRPVPQHVVVDPLAVLVVVAEDELSRLHVACWTEPLDAWLGDAVVEAEAFVRCEARRAQRGRHRPAVRGPAQRVYPVSEPSDGVGVDEQEQMDLRGAGAAPLPVIGIVLVDVAEQPGPVRRRHAGAELLGKAGPPSDVRREELDTAEGEADVQRCLGRPGRTVRHLGAPAGQRAPGGHHLGDREQHERRLRQSAEPADQQTLQVLDLDARRSGHSRASHSSADGSSIVRSMPSRISVLSSTLRAGRLP